MSLEFDKITSRYNSISNIQRSKRDMLTPYKAKAVRNWHDKDNEEYDGIKF